MSRRPETRPVDLLVLSSFPPGVGGGEIQTRAQLRRMVEHGRRVHVIDLEPRHDGPPTENDAGISVHRIRTPRTPVARALVYHATIASLVCRLGPRSSVAQFNHLGTGMITATPLLAALGVPRTLVVWGSAAPGVGPFGKGLRHRLARWFARRQTAVVALSSATRDNLVRQGFEPDRVRFIPNGVDTDSFRPRNDDDPPWDRPPRWPTGGPIAVTVGRLVPAKGLDVLLRSWQTVARAIPRARLVLVGGGPLEGSCASMVRDLGLGDSVSLIGARQDVPRILRNSDVYVSSSRTEGMSNALLEALASGLPLVATGVGGASDTVEDGVNGRIVLPDDPPALASALCELLGDASRRAAMGAASRRIALARFALDRIVERYVALFAELGAAA